MFDFLNARVWLILGLALVAACQQATAPEDRVEPVSLVTAKTSSRSSSDPTSKQQCKNGGWRAFGFRNQGQCVRFVQTGKDSRLAVEVKFASVSAGGDHSCGITTAGAVYCWGLNNSGQLGDGTHVTSAIPVAVSGSLHFASVAAGTGHTCGITTSGTAYCWGENDDFGQLGDGTTTESNVPVAVSGGLLFVSVSAGGEYSCGVTTAASAYCWGDNSPPGHLGDGTDRHSSVPVAVLGGLDFASVSADLSHACGLTVAGSAYCWGFNSSGQLGSGTTNSGSTVPRAVSGGLAFDLVSAGWAHSCGVSTGGAAFCWGANFFGGPLGNGTDANSNVPVVVSGGHTFSSVSAGGFHSCGVTTAGTALCWGNNIRGKLGNGTNTESNVPVVVSGGHAFASVSTGGEHSCGVNVSGVVYCWGRNDVGQLGNGVNIDSNVPMPISPVS